jgi:hypothetical protein
MTLIRRVTPASVIALTLFTAGSAATQGASRTLVAVFAHGDDESPAAPILARDAREGVQVHMIIGTDGSQGAAHTSIPRGPEHDGPVPVTRVMWTRRGAITKLYSADDFA